MKQVFNPYTPINEYIPDCEPHVFGDRVYVYGSHDKEGGEFFCMLDYVTYSAPVDNLKDWRYEGVIYKASQDPLYSKYRYMYAPDVVKGNDGRYYLYYSMADTHGASFIISVAVADNPAGPFDYLGVVKNPDGTPLQDYVVFDPGLFNDSGHTTVFGLILTKARNTQEKKALRSKWSRLEKQERKFSKLQVALWDLFV